MHELGGQIQPWLARRSSFGHKASKALNRTEAAYTHDLDVRAPKSDFLKRFQPNSQKQTCVHKFSASILRKQEVSFEAANDVVFQFIKLIIILNLRFC